MGKDGAMLTPNELVFTFGVSYVCVNFGENQPTDATVRVRIYRRNDRRKPVL